MPPLSSHPVYNVIMNQRFLTNFSLIVIKHHQSQLSYSMGNESFLRSEIFLSTNQTQSNFENYLFYAQTDPGGNYEFKTLIEFQQEVIFRHKLSNKFLAYVVEYKDEDSDSIVRLELADKPCSWRITPCFQYQTKISPKVKFNEDVYLATELNSTKLGFVAVRQGEQKDQLRTNISLNLKSKLMLHSYFQFEREEKGYIYGQAVWIKHVESNTFTTVLQPETKQIIAFESLDMEDNIQSINGLWLIESIKTENGGNLNYNQPFYLKSLCTQKYLTYTKKNSDRQVICLEEKPSLDSRFYFQSLNGDQSKIRRGAYLIFRHSQSGVYLGTRQSIKAESIFHYSMLTFTEFQDEDLFDLMELKTEEEQAIRFIFSVKTELVHINRLFSDRKFVLNKRSIGQIAKLYQNIIGELNKLAGSQLYEQVQQELGPSINHLCEHIREIRLRMGQQFGKDCSELIRSIYEILRKVCANYRENQIVAYKFLRCFVEDIFNDSGAEELFSEIFRNNYSLLCKIPADLRELSGCNLIKAIFSRVAVFSKQKTAAYWGRIEKLCDLLHVLLHHRQKTIDINQRLIATQLFDDQLFTRIFFQLRVFNQRIRIMHPVLEKWVEIQQLSDARFITILQRIFDLLSKLCENRNFISKQYIHKYLNSTNKDGVQIIISYLNIPISPKLSNHLFSLITNCYVDSSPRIDRTKPLPIINFTPEDAKDYRRQASSSLRENLLQKEESSEGSEKVWAISNILEGMSTNQPGLRELQFDLYKQQLNERLKEGEWSQELLRAVCMLVKLESYKSTQIQEIQRMVCESAMSSTIKQEIIVSTMDIFHQITQYSLQLQLKKVTAFLKYKFTKRNERQFDSKDIMHYLSLPKITPVRRVQREGVVDMMVESKVTVKYRKEYNKLVDALAELSPSGRIKKILLKMFIGNEHYPFSILSAIFKTILDFYSPKLRIVNLLTRCIVLTHQQIDNFQEIFILYKKCKHLCSIAEHWISSPSIQQSQQYYYILLQFTNYLFEDYQINSEQDRRFRRGSKLNINRQLLILNISVHTVILDLLNSNFYLLQNKNRNEIPSKIRDVFQISFEFLYFFCHHCQQALDVVTGQLQTIEKFRDLAEVGQTKLLIQIYKESPNQVKQVRSTIVEKMIFKIMRVPLTSTDHKQCEYNPEYLEFLNISCFDKEKLEKKNLELIYKVIEKDNIIRKILFLDGKGKMNLEPAAFKTNPLQVPVLYHKNLLQLLCLLFQYLEYSGSIIKHKIKDSINIQELLKVLALPDIYSHRGTIPEMNFLLKKEALVLLNLYLDRADSVSRLYDSQGLQNLLTHFVNIFIFNRQKQAYHCDNQIQFLPFIEQHSQEIRYDLKNQRDFYTSQVQPLLNRFLSFFEKYSNKDSNKNYQKLILLLENINISNLPQDHLLKHQVNGIDLIQLKWRNFVDADEENSAEEKFVKKTILELLRDEKTYKLVQEEKEEFFKTIKETEEEYFEMMSKLIKMASQEENQTDNSQESRVFFYEMIKNLAEYLVWTMKSSAEKKGWQGEQLAETLIGYITRQQFQFNNAVSRKTFYQILRILVFLLQNDSDSKLLREFYKIFSNTPSCFRFFNCLRDSLSQVSNRISGDKSHEQINQALSELYVCGEQRKCELDKQSLKFLTLLCKHVPFTELLRSQPYNTSTDFLDKIYNSFYFLVKRANHTGLIVNISIVDIAEDILDCVLAMLNGCNQANQNYIIDNKFPEIVVEALKMDEIHEVRNRGELAKRDRLIEEVCGFYLSNGINVEELITEKIMMIDFQHSYLLNRFKYTLLKLILQTTIANQRGLGKIRILIPIQLLKINLIWIYEDYKNQQIVYSQPNILRTKQEWPDIIKRQHQIHGIFLMIGFYYFQLIQYNNVTDKQTNQDEAQTATSEEKEKQKIIKKFFSSISDNVKNQERVKMLEKEPFAEEMKMFYDKYYQAYEFFSKRTLTIQASIFGNLIKLYFPKIPLCDKISEKMEEKLINQAERISHQEKIKSLMSFEKEVYDFLQGQEDYFIEMAKKSAILGKATKLVKSEDNMYFFIWCMSVIIVLGYLIDDFSAPSTNFSTQFASYLAPSTLIGIFILLMSMINLLCGFMLLINMIFRKIPFLLRLYESKYKEQLEEEGTMNDSIYVYQAKNILSASFFDFYTIGFSILTIMHPLFAGFLLVYIVKTIELGKTIVRAIEETWFGLVVAAGLLIVFNYIFSILIYCASFTDDVGYGTTCTTLFTCLLMLVDQSLKAGSGFLATNTPDYVNMTLNFKVIAEIMYILFAQKVIFQIFSGTIIDKFGELREQGDATAEDESSNCYICGQQRFQIDFQLQGFEEHVGKTHNKMNYIYYMFYLRRKSKREYGIEEGYVWQAHEKQINDWIPDGTSIEKLIKDKQENEENDEDDIEEYQRFYQKKLQEFKKMHLKVENMSSQLKEENLSL